MSEYRCTRGHDRCDQMIPGPECPYCEPVDDGDYPERLTIRHHPQQQGLGNSVHSKYMAVAETFSKETDRRYVREDLARSSRDGKCIGADPLCPCQDGDPCHYVDHGDTKGWSLEGRVRQLAAESEALQQQVEQLQQQVEWVRLKDELPDDELWPDRRVEVCFKRDGYWLHNIRSASSLRLDPGKHTHWRYTVHPAEQPDNSGEQP